MLRVSKARCFTNTDALPPYLKFPPFFVLCLFCGSNGSKVTGFLFLLGCEWLQRVTQYLATIDKGP